MKLIGITGKAGAGKTTLSDIIGRNQDVGVIHVDELFEKVKREKLSGMMECNSKGKPVAVKKNIRKVLYGNKYIFLIFIRTRAIILSGKINEKLKEFEKAGKNVAVIESTHLKYYPIFKKLDKKVLIRRPYIVRQKSVLLRDKEKNMDKEIFALWDIPYKRSYYKENMDNYEYKIDNESIEKLEQVAEQIYKDVTETENSITSERKRRKACFEKYIVNVKNIEKNTVKNNRQSEINLHNLKESEEKEIYEVR